MKKFFCLAVSFLLLAGCKPAAEKSAFSGEAAYNEAAALVQISPRDSGTGNARRAAVHLETRLKELGVNAAIMTFPDDTPAGQVFFHNVVGRLPGKTNRLIILGSHFDTKSGIAPDFQGANDSGSSTGVLLELARVLAARAPYETEFMFAFFDGEECMNDYKPNDGLHGSRNLARHIYTAGGAQHVEAVIILDMIGDKDLKVTVPRNSSRKLTKTLFAAAEELGHRARFGLARGDILDDHVPFLAAGMPAIDIIDFEYGSAPGLNDYWHTPADTLDKLSVDSMQTVGDTVLRMIELLQ